MQVNINQVIVSEIKWIDAFQRHKGTFSAKKIELVPIEQDFVEKLWTDRPSKPTTPVYIVL